MLPAILGLMLMVVVIGTVGALNEYQLWGHLIVAFVAAACAVRGFATGRTRLAAVAVIIAGGAAYLAVDTFHTGEDAKVSLERSRAAEASAIRLRERVMDEMGLPRLDGYVTPSSPRFADYTDRVDARIRAQPWFGQASNTANMRPLCRLTIALELGLRGPSGGSQMGTAVFQPQGAGWINEKALALFLSQSTPPRHPVTVSYCAKLFGFTAPT